MERSLLGITRIMTNGMAATVIADRGSKDIDVQFADGTIVEHKTRRTFNTGKIGNPTLGSRITSHRSIVNETRMMNCGMLATVICDRNAQDIDVRFEDGSIVQHKERASFRKGEISCPSLGKTYATHISRAKNSSILGLRKEMSNGQFAEVIEDFGSKNITVRFEDGTIVKHRSRTNFKIGSIRNPNLVTAPILGTTLKMRNGLMATCIEYRSSKDIDIQFEDGKTVYHKSSNNFLRGRIAHPEISPYKQITKSLLGVSRMMNCGMKATVIEDRNYHDIDIKFEDGTIVLHRTRSNFITGGISNPNYLAASLPEALIFHFIKQHFPDSRRSYRPKWLKNPETNIPLEIDIWIPSKRVGIEYDGGFWHREETERSKTKYNLFKQSNKINTIITVLEKGAIVHSSDKHINFQLHYGSNVKEYVALLGELELIIHQILLFLGIEENITIDDNLIDQIKTEGRYSKAPIEIPPQSTSSIVGLKVPMSCGMNAVCIAYRNNKDIDIEFEDGVIVYHTDKARFITGKTANPSFPANYKRSMAASILGETSKMNCGMTATVIAYRRFNDIDVQFEDGTVVIGRTKDQFLKGIIANPNLGAAFSRRRLSADRKIGQSSKMKNGLIATIINYRSFSDIDICFEDNTIVSHKSYDSFLKGTIKNPNYIVSRKTDITGEAKMMNCGMIATVIRYANANDIDVEFTDGTVVCHKSKDSFKKGAILNPNLSNRKQKHSSIH